MKNKLIKTIPLLLVALALVFSLFGCGQTTTTSTAAITTATAPSTTIAATTTTTTAALATRVITDMYGANITVPAVINRVIATGPVETQLLYILAPEKLVGLNAAWNDNPSFIGAAYKNIPVIGNSSSGSFNYEAATATNPDIVLEGKTKNLPTDREKFGTIPVVGVNAGDDLLTMYENEITFVANLLGVPDRGTQLIAYYKDAMSYVNGIVSGLSDAEKVRVYYAEGNDGLQTDAQGSWHTNLLAYCGGLNVADVQVSNTSQAVQVSLEQIYAWNTAKPIDMIIIGRSSQAATYDTIINSKDWQMLDCVKNGKVYVRPDNPTSWFDGPPGYGQILGMYWMVHLLYPDKTSSLDLNAKIKEFYSKFLHYDLSDTELASLTANPK